jgi:D-inositol-3-phosphate glycosyltransferase
MNVAMLSYHTCPLAILGGKDTGGMNVYVRDLTRELGRIGVHVDVFTRSQDEHVPHIVHELGFGNRVVHVPAGPEVPAPKSKLVEYVPQFTAGVRAFADAKHIRYDLIHSHYWLSGLVAESLAESWPGVPIVQMFHTLGEMKNRVARSDEEREGPERIAAEKQLLARADRIIVSTLAEQTQLRFLYKADDRKLEIIPPGVDLQHFYPIPADEAKLFVGRKPDDRMVLFVGRIERLKGVETLIRAMSRLKLEGAHRPVHLAVIGGEPEASPDEITAEMRRLQQLCDELGMDQSVVFLGKRRQDTLQYYYSAAEVVVLPSHYESFGMVALEAMACGRPVIASDVGGLGFLVQDGETGFTVPDDDVELLLARLSLLLVDRQLRTRMGAAAAAYAQDYSWDKIARRILSVYQELVSIGEP